MRRLVIALSFIFMFAACASKAENNNKEEHFAEHTEPKPIVQSYDKPEPPELHQPKQPAAPIKPPEKKPALPVNAFIPNRLEIPAIKVKTKVAVVGVLENGQMGVPKQFDRVGILSPWTKPGEKGNAVIAGHVDHYTGPAVFFNLKKLKVNDKVIVSNNQGKSLQFIVKSVESFKTDEAPLKRIFGKSDKVGLNLITCTGKFNRKKREHPSRLVVFTELWTNRS